MLNKKIFILKKITDGFGLKYIYKTEDNLTGGFYSTVLQEYKKLYKLDYSLFVQEPWTLPNMNEDMKLISQKKLKDFIIRRFMDHYGFELTYGQVDILNNLARVSKYHQDRKFPNLDTRLFYFGIIHADVLVLFDKDIDHIKTIYSLPPSRFKEGDVFDGVVSKVIKDDDYLIKKRGTSQKAIMHKCFSPTPLITGTNIDNLIVTKIIKKLNTVYVKPKGWKMIKKKLVYVGDEDD